MLLQATITSRPDDRRGAASAKAIDEVDATIKEIRTSIFTLVDADRRRAAGRDHRGRARTTPTGRASSRTWCSTVRSTPPSPPRSRRNLLAVVREAVSNASRHAAAEAGRGVARRCRRDRAVRSPTTAVGIAEATGPAERSREPRAAGRRRSAARCEVTSRPGRQDRHVTLASTARRTVDPADERRRSDPGLPARRPRDRARRRPGAARRRPTTSRSSARRAPRRRRWTGSRRRAPTSPSSTSSSPTVRASRCAATCASDAPRGAVPDAHVVRRRRGAVRGDRRRRGRLPAEAGARHRHRRRGPTGRRRAVAARPGAHASGSSTACASHPARTSGSPGSPPRSARSSRCIAEGLTNRQIAERMFLAEKTVKNYVSNLLSKLGMQRRTQAAVFGADVLRDPGRDRP